MKKMERYRGPKPLTVMAKMFPRIETIRGMTMWKQRSFLLAEEYAIATEPQKATKYGGAVRRRVMVLLKPRVLMIEGKK